MTPTMLKGDRGYPTLITDCTENHFYVTQYQRETQCALNKNGSVLSAQNTKRLSSKHQVQTASVSKTQNEE